MLPVVIDNPNGPAFECTRCGECCFDQTVWLDPWDVRRLGTGTFDIVEDAGVYRARLRMQTWLRGTKCGHLQAQWRDDALVAWNCALHGTDQKPLVCRTAPLAQLDDGTWWVVAPTRHCNGFERGPARQWSAEVDASLQRLEWARWFRCDRERSLCNSFERAMAVYSAAASAINDLELLDLLKGDLADADGGRVHRPVGLEPDGDGSH